MFGIFQKSMGWSLIFAILVGGVFAADNENGNEEAKHPFSVKFVDENGKPVQGAKAGVIAHFPGYQHLTTIDETGWHYDLGGTSNADGIASFPDGRDRKIACVVARQTERKLVAVWKIDSDKLDPKKNPEPATIAMYPECRITGRFTCRELTKRTREIGWTNVLLKTGGQVAFGCESREQTFHFFVPSGDYVLDMYGTKLHRVEQVVAVKTGQHELDLGDIELPATPLALLEGQPAPKLDGIACWKNGPAVSLEDLKGKCVLLDFWGYWCAPCVSGMPELFKLYDKYHEQGLEIIGIHVDLGEDEKEPVDTVEKLDGRLSKIRKGVWKGRDVPYPVAVVTGNRTSYSAAYETDKARSHLAAQYGVTMYPTLILITPQGTVVGRFSPRIPEHMQLLEKLLQDK